MNAPPWFPFPRTRPRASIDLYCLPCAGAAASLYRGWRDAAPASFEVVPVELPGRGRRFREKPISVMDALVPLLAAEVAAASGDRPIALFGHSMGALVAFELARVLGARARHLFVSASPAPHMRIGKARSVLSDEELKRELADLGGTPAEVLENPEMMEILFPMIRADFALVETYRGAAPGPLPCSVTVFAGTHDPYVDQAGARAWESYASGSFRLVPIAGHHFYLDVASSVLLEEIARDLADPEGVLGPPMTLALAPGEVIVYIARPERLRAPGLVARFEAVLTDEERARVRRFRFDEHRHEHRVTYALIRASLSRHRPVLPEAWRFRNGAHGRPEIDPPCGLSFNATNTLRLVACAVAEGFEVGVDVEAVTRAEAIIEVARTVFATPEMESLRALASPPEAASVLFSGHQPSDVSAAYPQRARALALWTLKEAYIKARGMGLALPLREIAFDLGPGREIAFETASTVDPDPARWRFRLIDLEDHMLAVALPAGSSPLSVRLVETALHED